MSTIKADNLQNRAGTASVPVDTVVAGSAKAWVNFNGTGAVAIRAAFNVSSITDNGVGDYTLNFTTALADGNYATSLSCAVNATTAGLCSPMGAAPTASALRVRTYGATMIGTDCEYVFASVNR